jgi:hypothetical protein
MLFNNLKAIAWISIISLLIAAPISCIDNRSFKEEDKFAKDMQKVKLGITYKELRSLLGSPTVILFSKLEDFEKYSKTDPKIIPIYILETNHDSRTKSGEIDWLYVHYDENSIDLGFPVYSFDLNSGRLIRVSRRDYEGS